MNIFQDKWSRYHHKPCINGEPRSGNGWIYSAYARKVGLPLDSEKLGECFNLCRVDDMTLIRNPYHTSSSPISRDEILGMAYLGVLKPKSNVAISWNFSPYPIPEFSATKLAEQLKLLYKHQDERNYFWQNNLDQIYRFAFSVPVVDRYFLLKCWNKFQWYNPIHLFYATVSKVDSMKTPKERNGIAFLKYGTGAKEMCAEFPVDHPIRVKLGL